MPQTPTEIVLQPTVLIERLGLHPGMRVGDFGVGGAAFFAAPLAQKVGPSGEVLMFDVKKSALSSAIGVAKMHGLKNCKAVWCDLEVFEGARGIGQGSLDAGVLINVLHQSKKHQELLTEIHRMLKTSAKLLVTDWQPQADLPVAPPRHERLAADHVEMLARTLGFAAFERFQASPVHWGLVLVKT